MKASKAFVPGQLDAHDERMPGRQTSELQELFLQSEGSVAVEGNADVKVSKVFVHGRPEAAADERMPKRQRSEQQELPVLSQSPFAVEDRTTGQSALPAAQVADLPGAVGAASQATPPSQPVGSQEAALGDVINADPAVATVTGPPATPVAGPSASSPALEPCKRCFRPECDDPFCPFPGLEGYALSDNIIVYCIFLSKQTNKAHSLARHTNLL
jgi:hypothetical protein